MNQDPGFYSTRQNRLSTLVLSQTKDWVFRTINVGPIVVWLCRMETAGDLVNLGGIEPTTSSMPWKLLPAIAELQRVRDAAASVSAQQSSFADCLRLRAGTAKSLAAEIENLLS